MAKEIIISIVVLLVTGFIALQFKSFKEWLVWGTLEAEKYLGTKTGEAKLMYVFNLAVSKYPFITKIITFNMFEKFVDSALIKMRDMIENNKNIKEFLKETKVVEIK